MKIIALIAAVAAFATLGVAAAQAEPGYSTANVNMRTGPDIEYPSVGVIPEGEPLYVEGCLQDESWCDVRWADNRGWVYSEYIGFDYHGQTAYLPDVGIAAFGIPESAFTDEEDIVGFWKANHDYGTLVKILSDKYRAENGTEKPFPFRKLETGGLGIGPGADMSVLFS